MFSKVQDFYDSLSFLAKLRLGLAGFGLAAMVVGGGLIVTGSAQALGESECQEGRFLSSESGAEEDRELSLGKKEVMVVDIGGAVKNPGIYELQSGARVGELVELAGGLVTGVDYEYVGKELNLSLVLADADKIYVPFAAEKLAAAGTAPKLVADIDSGLISLNSGSAKELETLEGIGAKRAGDLIAGRPYSKVEEIVTRRIVTQSLFDKFKNELRL